MTNNVKVKRSRIPNAGQGLFADKPFERGDVIIRATGKIIDNKAVAALAEAGKDIYLLGLDRKRTMNISNKAMYANDANGLTKISGARNNANFFVDGTKAYIMATRKIERGDEIYVTNGHRYWQAIKSKKAKHL